jgi:hypothetical protein
MPQRGGLAVVDERHRVVRGAELAAAVHVAERRHRGDVAGVRGDLHPAARLVERLRHAPALAVEDAHERPHLRGACERPGAHRLGRAVEVDGHVETQPVDRRDGAVGVGVAAFGGEFAVVERLREAPFEEEHAREQAEEARVLGVVLHRLDAGAQRDAGVDEVVRDGLGDAQPAVDAGGEHVALR